MSLFAANLLLALAWAALSGEATLSALASGFGLGFLMLWLLQPMVGGDRSYFLRVVYGVRLVLLFFWELVVSSLHVAWDVLTPMHRARPALVEVPLDLRSDLGVLLLTNLISLTPGTLSVDVSGDRRRLLVHAMFAEDPDRLRREIKGGMERWVREALEP
jgi:multicomponent Na+:H+ antiporter subunit E